MAGIDLSPKQLDHRCAALDRFEQAYTAYLQGGPNGGRELKDAAIDAIPAADEALSVAGSMFYVDDPPALGPARQRRAGLRNTAFLHETPGYQPIGHDKALYETLLEAVRLGRSTLVHQRTQAQARRRRPTYWIDRFMRALVKPPAYLVGLIIGESVAKIDRSAWGLPLRVVGLLADVLAVYFGGQALGLW